MFTYIKLSDCFWDFVFHFPFNTIYKFLTKQYNYWKNNICKNFSLKKILWVNFVTEMRSSPAVFKCTVFFRAVTPSIMYKIAKYRNGCRSVTDALMSQVDDSLFLNIASKVRKLLGNRSRTSMNFRMRRSLSLLLNRIDLFSLREMKWRSASYTELQKRKLFFLFFVWFFYFKKLNVWGQTHLLFASVVLGPCRGPLALRKMP